MPKTQLSPTGLPGRGYSFTAKTAATVEHTGEFTAQSVTATPGQRHAFLPKTPAVQTSEQITALSVMALPGRTRTFTAKTEAEIVVPPEVSSELRAGLAPGRRYEQHDHDEQDIVELLEIILMADIL